MSITGPELERLYLELEVPLYNFALRWIWNPAAAEDLVQEAFVRLWRRRDEVLPETFKGLIYKTVHNLCLNERRKRRWLDVVPALEIISSAPSAQEDFIQQQNLGALRTALEGLSDDLREVLLMTEFSDLSYEQVALALDIPAGTVASRKNRALAELRARMKEAGHV